jgi:hypothetical protein
VNDFCARGANRAEEDRHLLVEGRLVKDHAHFFTTIFVFSDLELILDRLERLDRLDRLTL